MPSTSYVPTLLRTSSPTSGEPLAPKRLCLRYETHFHIKVVTETMQFLVATHVKDHIETLSVVFDINS